MTMEKYGTVKIYTNVKTGETREVRIGDKSPGNGWTRDEKMEEKIAEAIVKDEDGRI